MNTMHTIPQKRLDECYDLAVVGGGLAGVMTAVAAAREGKRVILLEKYGCLGGMATAGLVYPFMRHSEKPSGRPANKGLYFRLLKEIYEIGGSDGEESRHYKEEFMKIVLDRMTRKAGVKVLFHAKLCEVEREGRSIQSITVATVSGKLKIRARVFADTTGNADLCAFAGLPFEQGREEDGLCQPMTLCFRVGNADVEKFFKSHKRLNEEYAKAQATGEITNPRHNVLVFKTPIKNVLHFNTTRVVKKNPTNAFDVTEAEIIARRQVYEIYDFMKKHADGLENSFLMMTAAEIGVRESRMIVGDYVLTEEDCRNCVKFEDAIAACNYDIDIHNPEGTGTSHYYFPAGAYYTIPYRSLIPKQAENMLVAGRCISSDHGAQASYRIMPVVCCLGEAAGSAIGLATKSNCSTREINVEDLQNVLIKNGAYIGV